MSRKFIKVVSILLAAAMLVPSGWFVPMAEAAASETTVIYHETFESGKGAATQSGGVSLTPKTDKFFEGNADGAALYVSNRANNWDAVDFQFSNIGLENGKTYTVTVTGFVDADVAVPAGAQAFLQMVNSYSWLAGADFVQGSSFTLTKEFTVNTSSDTSLRIQSNDDGAMVPFYIGDVLITEQAITDGGEEEETRPPALDFNTITFEDQTTGGFTGRAGTETLTVTNEANHTAGGSYALKVEGRSSTWHGPSLRVETYVDQGYEYKISAWVKLISPASSQLQLSTQVGNGSSASYVALAPKTISSSDGWVQFEGTYRYNNASSEYLTIYVESTSNSTAAFYIDDISFESTSSGPVAIQKDLTPIKDAYQSDFLIGNAISAEDLQGVRLELLKLHHNVATAGNAMKPDALQPTKGNYTFTAADAMVDKILAEGMQMHGHVLVWHQQSPEWMNTQNGAPLGREEALINLRDHIQTVMEHFGNKVISWDVVNEAMSDNPSNPTDWQAALRKSPWYNAIGPDYVEQAFLAAREVLDSHPEWDVKLYYNDYNEDNQNKAQAIYSMVKELNDRYALEHPDKLLVDGVGMQAHYGVNTNPENVKQSLERFISLGVEVSITELDIQAGSDYQLSEDLANAQGYLYAKLFEIFRAHAANIARVTFWGMDDSTSWRASSNPLLFDKNLQAKPAYYGVIDPDTFIEEHEPEYVEANQSTAVFATPAIDGVVDDIWSQAPEMAINKYQLAWQGANGVAKALWDNENLYVLIQVSDTQLDETNENAWEQDSVEIFLDENNGKTTYYEADDGQYRINFNNITSFSPSSIATGFNSATIVSGTNYTVEVQIPLKTITPGNGTKLGFDVQINDAKDGARQSVAAWNDTTGNGYMDTSVYGVLTLADEYSLPSSDASLRSLDLSGMTLETVAGSVYNYTATVPNSVTVTSATYETSDNKATAVLKYNGEAASNPIALSVGSNNNISVEVTAQDNSVQVYNVVVTRLANTGGGSVPTPTPTETASPTPKPEEPSIFSDKVDYAAFISYWTKQILLLQSGSTTIELSDIANHWANTNIVLAEKLGVVSGYEDGSFKPNGSITRAEFASMIAKVFNLQASSAATGFSDADSHWAKQAISALASSGVINGYENGTFRPDSTITRAEIIAIISRLANLEKVKVKDAAAFTDIADSWNKEEIEAAYKAGIVEGRMADQFAPNASSTRAEALTLILRVLELDPTIKAFLDKAKASL